MTGTINIELPFDQAVRIRNFYSGLIESSRRNIDFYNKQPQTDELKEKIRYSNRSIIDVVEIVQSFDDAILNNGK